MSRLNIILLGYSGHAKVVIDCFESHDVSITGYLDKTESNDNKHGLTYLGYERTVDLSPHSVDHSFFPSVGENALRSKMVELLKQKGLKQTRAIHSTAFLSNYANVGLSTMIGPKAVINSGANIGDGVIINSNATVEHDCRIGNFTHIAPGSTLAGNVKVGDFSFIGAGTVIKQGVSIGNNAVIGAGAVVLSDVPDNETWAGVPAKKIK